MRKWRGIGGVFVFGLMLLAIGEVGAGVISGKIEFLSAQRNTIAVNARGKTETFRVPAGAEITLNGKPAELADLAVGGSASVFTDKSDNVTRISARSATTKKPATPPSKPRKTPPSTPTPRPRGNNGADEEATAGTWPQFLGPNRDNISGETGLLARWPDGGPKLLWTADGLGAAYSTVSVADGMVFTMGNVRDAEMIFAMKFENGEKAWETRSGAAFREGAGDGPRSVPTIDAGRAYALGANGDLTCVEAATGQVRWKKNILEEFGGRNIQWGICESVLIDGDKLICTPGGQTATLAALNKNTGAILWRALVPGGERPAYASAIPVEVGGVRQYVQFTSRGTLGVRAQDGELLWSNTASANGTANCSAPVFSDDMVFTASGYGTGGAMLRLQSRGNLTAATQAYFTKEMKNHHGGMVIVDGFLYGSNDPGVLTCIELKSGDVRWQNRSVGKGSLTCADGKLILRSENGPVALIDATPEEYRELGRFDPPARSGRNTWAYPVVAGGRLFLRDQDKLYCYDLKGE